LHSTGHKSRLNRPGIVETHFFGDEIYSKEELVAEKGAAMICGISGIENKTIKNSASYIQSWLGKLKDDKNLWFMPQQQRKRPPISFLVRRHSHGQFTDNSSVSRAVSVCESGRPGFFRSGIYLSHYSSLRLLNRCSRLEPE
jgi:Zincin-like metallopeptidase